MIVFANDNACGLNANVLKDAVVPDTSLLAPTSQYASDGREPAHVKLPIIRLG